MAFLRVYHTYELDIVEIPDEIEKDILEHADDFLNWITGRYVERRGGLCFEGSKEFVEYLNKEVLMNSPQKAKIIAEDIHPTKKEKDKIKFYKKIWF